jgi:hypothetical protein
MRSESSTPSSSDTADVGAARWWPLPLVVGIACVIVILISSSL